MLGLFLTNVCNLLIYVEDSIFLLKLLPFQVIIRAYCQEKNCMEEKIDGRYKKNRCNLGRFTD